jgi:hypothetical protein
VFKFLAFFRRRRTVPRLSRDEFIRTLQSFLDGSEHKYGWDDILSVPIRDPELDHVREKLITFDASLGPSPTALSWVELVRLRAPVVRQCLRDLGVAA